MNTSQLSNYAPQARTAFIAAVSAQASRLGITADGNAEARVQGDVLMVGGQALPNALASVRKSLTDRVDAQGFAQTMESIAYTWFNRFVAIRYMELHGYLDHGYRVLSSGVDSTTETRRTQSEEEEKSLSALRVSVVRK